MNNTEARRFLHSIGLAALGAAFLLFVPLVCNAQTANTFQDGPSMPSSRFEFTATSLYSGKVLVAGGITNGTTYLNTSALYDPFTGIWSNTGTMTTSRAGHTATLLPNGKVLVAGGYDGATFKTSGEIYDPATGAWTAVTNAMSGARRFHTATQMDNGLVLLVGGGNSSALPLSAVDVYHPGTNSFSSTQALAVGREKHTATLLPNGSVFVFGGSRNGTPVGSAEIYNPTSAAWTTVSATGTARAFHSATLLHTGKVLLAGGATSNDTLKTVELFDPTNQTFSVNAAPNQLVFAKERHTATLLPNGNVLLVGGLAGTALAGVEMYNPTTNVFTRFASLLAENRSSHTATLLHTGRVLIAGGYNSLAPMDSTLLFEPAEANWSSTGALSHSNAQSKGTMVLLTSGKVIVAGGTTNALSNTPTAASNEYDPVAGNWFASGSSLLTARHSANGVLLPTGKVLVFGGVSTSGAIIASAELYDPASRTWSATGSMSIGRTLCKAVVLPNGRVLIAGGITGTFSSPAPVSSVEIYDPVTGSWSPTGSLSAERIDYAMSLLPNGKVLITGGKRGGQLETTNTAELYDSDLGTWSSTGSMTIARSGPAATVLPTGKVIVISGVGTRTNEIYDPATGTWTVTGDVYTERRGGLVTVLLNGKVMIAGGVNPSGYGISSVETYDPAVGGWRVGAPFNVPVTNPATFAFADLGVLLPNGKFLMVGAFTNDGSNYTSTAQLYDEGRGASLAAQPVITAATLDHDTRKLTLTGTGFRGLSGASTGSYQDSSSNVPLVHWRSLNSGHTGYLPVDPTNTSVAGSTRTAPIPMFLGTGIATVVVNGVPGEGVLVSSNVLSAKLDSDGDGMNDLAEWQGEDFGLRFLKPQPSEVAKFFGAAASAGMYSQAQYDSSLATGRDQVIANPNAYDLYSNNQIQALHVDTPLVKRDAATGKFTLTLGVGKTTLLGTIPFSPFPFSNAGGFTTTINGAGKIEFTFPATEDAAFYRVEAR
jgi:N-acetylneuraminic acid mutarotase